MIDLIDCKYVVCKNTDIGVDFVGFVDLESQAEEACTTLNSGRADGDPFFTYKRVYYLLGQSNRQSSQQADCTYRYDKGFFRQRMVFNANTDLSDLHLVRNVDNDFPSFQLLDNESVCDDGCDKYVVTIISKRYDK